MSLKHSFNTHNKNIIIKEINIFDVCFRILQKRLAMFGIIVRCSNKLFLPTSYNLIIKFFLNNQFLNIIYIFLTIKLKLELSKEETLTYPFAYTPIDLSKVLNEDPTRTVFGVKCQLNQI